MTLCNKTLEGYDLFSAPCVLRSGHSGGHVAAGGTRDEPAGTDTEESTCRVSLYLGYQSFDCVLPENHREPHKDADNATWDLVYREPVTGLGSLEISDLSRRVTALEAAWTVGGETLSERLDRVILGMQEQHRFVALRVDNLEQTSASGAAVDDMLAAVNRRLDKLEAGVHPEECHGEQCVKDQPTVIGETVAGMLVMSDGSLRPKSRTN